MASFLIQAKIVAAHLRPHPDTLRNQASALTEQPHAKPLKKPHLPSCNRLIYRADKAAENHIYLPDRHHIPHETM